MKHLISYTNCWEDAYLLDANLQVDEQSQLMSIASGGDNTIYLLKNNPKQVICVDHNVHQLYLTELKSVAIQYLSYKEVLLFLGISLSENRKILFEKFSTHLTIECKKFWLNHFGAIEKGIIHQGKFEHYLRIFGKKIIPLIHTEKRVNALLAKKSELEQIKFYNEEWNNLRWKFLFKVFFSRFTMSKLGRDQEKFKEVNGEISNTLMKQTNLHFQSTLCQDNYILNYILYGSFTKLPPYLQPDVFQSIKNWLQNNSITYINGKLDETLKQYQNCNRFNLSNIFEYMNKETSDKLMSSLVQHSKIGSRFSLWNLFVIREMNLDTVSLVKQEFNHDRGFFYHQFLTYEH